MRGVSTRDQELIGQIGALKAAGAQTIFREKNRLNQSAQKFAILRAAAKLASRAIRAGRFTSEEGCEAHSRAER